MPKNFNLAFNAGEEDLLAAGKAAFGNNLGRVLKDGLRAALSRPEPEPSAGDTQPTEEQQLTKIGDILVATIGDLLTDYKTDIRQSAEESIKNFIRLGDARGVMKRRITTLRLNYPDYAAEVEHRIKREFPLLGDLIK